MRIAGTAVLALTLAAAAWAQPGPGTSPETAGALEAGVPQEGTVGADGQGQFYRFYAEQGYVYMITTQLGGGQGDLHDSLLTLLGTDGAAEIASNDDYQGLASRITWSCPETGHYFVRVSSYGNSGTGRFTVVLEQRVATVQAGASAAEARAFVPPSMDGEILSSGDRQWYSFPAAAGQAYTITVSLGTLGDSYLELYGPDGTTQLATDDDSAGNLASRIIWTAPETGTYYFVVRAFSDRHAGSYSVSLVQGEVTGPGPVVPPLVEDAHPNQPGEGAVTLGEGAATEANLFPRQDRDAFRFSAVAGFEYLVEVELGTLQDSVLTLMDPQGRATLAENDDASDETLASRIRWRCDGDGTYWVVVGAWAPDDIGTYRIRVTPVPTPDHR